MKVTISVFGRFHAFNLAQQLQQKQCLKALISTYPTFIINRYGIEHELIRSIWHLEALIRAWRRVPIWLRGTNNLPFLFRDRFDRAAQDYISSGSDVFVGWSSLCLYSLRKAKELGALTVVDHGSSHRQYQTQILQEEYERWGLNFNLPYAEMYERELQEYAEADRIAVPSLFSKRTFVKRGISEKKLIYVPYGTSLTEFYPVPKLDNIFRVIHCGGIILRKGVQYLVKAFCELKLPDAELWLVGSLAPEMKPILAKYENQRIILKGKYPQSQLHWFYSQCSVFCLASIEDGFGMVIAQAMACGLPVIHTTNTGGEDIVRDGVDGFCIPIRDVEALKEKILFFYENPARRSHMGDNALKQARNSLSWNDYGEKMIAAYSTALAAK
ncbi:MULTISPECIES: glycosyltransferase family 4 protein [Cyanophyceae]|uniref:glycosyltransferase family 4 protein n=1 Tax=Cyanophyceae TaxID=3028117 RepID=UPI001686EFCE|nr:glycosyltransferase family 4 protein [Trichocoleus sp. FACHB-40]MBD2004203.1 glycosyltransferase family 4 protein [Trichocoleus sp. FACHB-40]